MLIYLLAYNYLNLLPLIQKIKKENIKIALCTMGKKENLYVSEFIEYYLYLGVDHIFIYDNNSPYTEKIEDVLGKKYKEKIIIRGNIFGLKYWVHSPYISLFKNVTCTNKGSLINYTNMNFEYIDQINIEKAYIIHFRFKSTEEFINKYKRGYSNWHGNRINEVLKVRLSSYFEENGITIEKINLIEKELKLNLSSYKEKIYLNNSKIYNKEDLIFD